MTMKIIIENDDKQRIAKVHVIDGLTGGPTEKQHVTVHYIDPGDSSEFWIHSGRHLVVEELQVE